MEAYYPLAWIALATSPCSAVPARNSTFGVAPTFVPEPTGRGTVGILISCILTLGLCIWTVIHPDISANKSIRGHLIYKVSWMIAGLFVPEILISNSWHQRHTAKRLHKRWLEVCKVKEGSKEDMGMEGAFFVVMGGCIVAGVQEGYTATVTPDGFIKLTTLGLIGKDILNKAAIKDKGKADALAKLLVCLQATWMVMQCVARKLNHLPVTLLEYHIAIQVGYALAIYFFWWYKPKDISEPIVVLTQAVIVEHMQDNDAAEEWEQVCRLVNQSKRYVIDDLISAGFDGHGDALMAAIMGIPAGVLHAFAWNSHFPSHIEKWIWRVSSIDVAVAPQCMYLQFLASSRIVHYTWLAGEDDYMHKRLHKQLMEKFPVAEGSECRRITSPLEMNRSEFAFYVTTWLNMGLYTAFSFSLAVIAFASLRSVPDGVYETLRWGDYWPHM